jgi:hypothetical protein
VTGEQPWLEAGDEVSELIAFLLRQVAAPPATSPNELDQPSALLAVQPRVVITGEQRDLGRSEQCPCRYALDARQATGGANEPSCDVRT